jgi:hypothetical protein
MAFYSQLWCMMRDLARTGNVVPSAIPDAMNCTGRIEVAHLGSRAGWRRCSDAETAPLCRQHHRDLDGRVGGKASWYVALGRAGQAELRGRLVQFADFYWQTLTPKQRDEWDAKASRGSR